MLLRGIAAKERPAGELQPGDDEKYADPYDDAATSRVANIGISSNTMRWLETIALGVFVYDLTASAFLVGFVGFLRMVPMLLLGEFIGALADRLSRKTMLIATNLSLAAMYVVLAALVITDLIAVWQVSVGAFLAGIVWATDFPVRRALVADTVRPERIASAFGADVASSTSRESSVHSSSAPSCNRSAWEPSTYSAQCSMQWRPRWQSPSDTALPLKKIASREICRPL